jgi:hypothetical protein
MVAITNGLALTFILNTRCVKNYISSTYLGLLFVVLRYSFTQTKGLNQKGLKKFKKILK